MHKIKEVALMAKLTPKQQRFVEEYLIDFIIAMELTRVTTKEKDFTKCEERLSI